MENNFKITYQVDDNLLKQMLKLDESVYKKEDCGTFEICKEWLSINNDIYTILLLDNKVIGYINFMPISDKCYNKFISGLKKDYEINSKDIIPFSKTKYIKCLLTSVVIHKDFQNSMAIKYLYNGFIEKIKKYAKENIKISNIILDCVSEDGEKFAKKYLNAKFIKETLSSKIYEVNLKIE